MKICPKFLVFSVFSMVLGSSFACTPEGTRVCVDVVNASKSDVYLIVNHWTGDGIFQLKAGTSSKLLVSPDTDQEQKVTGTVNAQPVLECRLPKGMKSTSKITINGDPNIGFKCAF